MTVCFPNLISCYWNCAARGSCHVLVRVRSGRQRCRDGSCVTFLPDRNETSGNPMLMSTTWSPCGTCGEVVYISFKIQWSIFHRTQFVLRFFMSTFTFFFLFFSTCWDVKSSLVLCRRVWKMGQILSFSSRHFLQFYLQNRWGLILAEC